MRRAALFPLAIAGALVLACAPEPDGDPPGAEPESVPGAAPNAGAGEDAPAGAGTERLDQAPAPGASPPSRTPPAAQPTDTLRGLLSLLGSEPHAIVMLRPTTGGDVRVVGEAARALAYLSGLEVWVTGSRQGDVFQADRFRVRALAGTPAVDGVLRRDDAGGFVLDTGERRIPLVSPPATLREHVGDRVWVAGPLDREPETFGVIPAG